MLMAPSRQGFTLAEVILASTIMLVVAGVLHGVLVHTHRLTRAQLHRIMLQSSVRTGSLIVVNELRESSTLAGGTAGQNDLLQVGPDHVTYRAMRGFGVLCQTPTATTLRIRRIGFSGHRDPQPGRDTAFVFVPGEAGAGGWLPVGIAGVSTGFACPTGLGPGITVTVPLTEALAGLEAGTPVRIAEVMQLRLYRSEGKSWLGARSVSAGEAIQPLVGPLADPGGLRLEYLDGANISTSDPAGIRSIRVTLRSGAAGNDRPQEELTARITLPNALGP